MLGNVHDLRCRGADAFYTAKSEGAQPPTTETHVNTLIAIVFGAHVQTELNLPIHAHHLLKYFTIH